ncbi:MAG: hypothetical protein HYX76_12720, partial [Acidobacteria bacterium]|nr:hypothetical protein [Acidobacteriota bacterium]
YTWSFSTSGGRPDPKSGPGGPILLVTNAGDPFGYYYAEILRTEGLNEFAVADVSELSPGMLSSFDVVLLAQTALSPAQAATLRDWVNGGGNLVAMRPDAELATLLGLTPTTATMTDGYLLINTASTAGAGLVNETIQFHGTADRYGLAGATKVATLYTAAGAATSNPAVSLVAAGAGQAAAFTYDLARSVAYSRQGNPAWAGQERDGSNPIRPNDLFWGGGNPDWIDLGKVAIPQADEQQRLLANLIITMNAARKPLPRFWYFPFGKPAVVLMTGDDHANGGTPGRFDRYLSLSPPGCSVTNWECVRSTAYIYPHTPMTDSQVASYEAQGFDVGVHVDTGCADWTPSTLEAFYAAQIGTFQSNFPSARPPAAGRTHCIVWSDWASQPKVQLAYGTRLDVNYYYWPPSWASTRPGFFTHSGMPMRFVDLDGSMIDVYQAATQLTDESGQVYPATLDTLLDRAMGATGYYGVFTANIHSDAPLSSDADAIVQSALTRGIPVVSAAQLLQWLDGRHGSSFESLSWSSGTLTFTISPGAGAVGLQAMLPTEAGALTFSGLANGGAAVPFQTTTVKGIGYAVFAASAGSYTATYSGAPPPPLPALSIDDITVTESATGSVSGLFTARLSESSTKTITVSYATADGSASAPADYLAKSGSLTFSPGATSATVAVTVNADGLVEPAENFFVNLTSPSNATLAKSQGTATILDAPSIAAPSGLGATAVSSTRVNLTWTDNATNETGYRVERRLLPGGVYGVIATLGTNATTFSDTGVGASSSYSYRVQASAGTMRSPYSNEASVTTPPGGLPSIAINDVTVSEPSTGTVNAIFNVTLSGPAPSTVSVNFVTANGSASAGNDYELNAGTLSFAPGVTSKAIPVLVKADAVTEPNETYFVNLSGATNATLAKNQGVGTIINGGPPPPTGSGLTGEYFASADLTNRKFTRVDPIVDFDWGKKSPDPSLPADGFSIRWSGELVPRFSETYTFYATTDDGVRLWVDGVLLINDWTKRGKKELKKTMALSSGKPYSIVMEFANFEGNAIAKLSWSSRSESKKIIPQSQLFP